ncbi:Putative trans-acting enoyl reductase [Zhongshania aliphaticivorans]|uniref:Trans-acting enoyl reductase n=1 Tax=Zhongshania aliphaticivorans TaxID=1470434 RepID=A0A5S9MRT7_9GAMM|nr:saccharopine dehydrogenase NADP-binding domain-containing protein [Zhongshania aliphaticivorans]CAA0079469.1 Putative trans-acting enoyl reductase [Zhongshania aliphaticivorans]CAA0086126.1 Putative trans-acting enoyl reductase [Zhongshania aliphaticivorans]
MKTEREFDLIIYGASGFTGQLIAEYIAAQQGNSGKLRWALAGRNEDKIRAVVAESGLPADLPIIAADSSDEAAVKALVQRTSVILTAVGPYQLYGSLMVKACAETGTDYVDLCGEPSWMRAMIEQHQATAQASGARIVFSCGFDSIPSDLGVFYLQSLAKEKTGQPAQHIKALVRGMQGIASGGTVASLKATIVAAAKDPAIGKQLKNPYGLVPGYEGVDQPESFKPCYVEDVSSWAAPFVMATINIPNVHRSNALLKHAYGEGFTYSEMMLTGPGEKGETIAKAMATPSLSNDDLKPGEGPSREEQEAGFYDLLFIGETASGEQIRASVAGDRDPGYGSTSRMISESALAMALDDIQTPGGIWTPAAAMGEQLIKRLTENAGLVFKAE